MKKLFILLFFLLGIAFISCSGTKHYSGMRQFEKRAFNPVRKLTKQEKQKKAEIERRNRNQKRTREEIEAKEKFKKGEK